MKVASRTDHLTPPPQRCRHTPYLRHRCSRGVRDRPPDGHPCRRHRRLRQEVLPYPLRPRSAKFPHGRGTFVLAGRPITDAETLVQLTMEDFETAIEVPRAERIYFGGISRR